MMIPGEVVESNLSMMRFFLFLGLVILADYV